MRLPNIPRRGRRDRHSRGQSLVEFALVLPIMLLLTVIALDFGRVYLGWINLQSMARIGGEPGGEQPDRLVGGGDADVKATLPGPDPATTPSATTAGSRWSAASRPRRPRPSRGHGHRRRGRTVAITCTFGDHHAGHLRHPGRVHHRIVVVRLPGQDRDDRQWTAATAGVPPNAAFTGNGDVAPSVDERPRSLHRRLPRHIGRSPDELAVGLQRRHPQLDRAGPARPRVHRRPARTS